MLALLSQNCGEDLTWNVWQNGFFVVNLQRGIFDCLVMFSAVRNYLGDNRMAVDRLSVGRKGRTMA